MVFSDPISAMQYVKSGALVALAVTSKERSPIAPDVPTIAESGYPGFDAFAWHGILAPAKTPPAIVAKLNTEIVKALNDPETKTLLETQAIQTPSAVRRRLSLISSSRIYPCGRMWPTEPR
jgi:tripartite-type tricarboxylate transporter receptor subunit TctC